MLNSSPEGVIFHQVYNMDKALLQLLLSTVGIGLILMRVVLKLQCMTD